jgi:hypothetical protein
MILSWGKKIYILKLALFGENVKTAGNCFPTVFVAVMVFRTFCRV